jgi:tRNA(His) 5'-end guanylyltransferase
MNGYDEFGNRMKSYEAMTEIRLMSYLPTFARVDGRSFHSFTKGMRRPYDDRMAASMIDTAKSLAIETEASMAYTQSDEISILLTDFATENTDAWFDGNIQKISSVASSILTAEFNRLRWARMIAIDGMRRELDDPEVTISEFSFRWSSQKQTAYFDCRAFTIPDRTEVMNYFRWRQQDCIRNSVSMVAQSNFSHKELHGKNQSDMHEMLHQIGVNWTTDYTDGQKNGRIIMKETYISYGPDVPNFKVVPYERTHWVSKGAWVFTKDEGKLLNMIPKYENEN